MIQTVQDALKWLKSAEVSEQTAASGFLKSNSHIHLPPNFSAFETVDQAVTLADEQDVRVLGVSNYYDHRVYAPFVELCRQKGIVPVFGLEIISLIPELVEKGVLINDPSNPGRMYICGKGITTFDPADQTPRAAELLGIIRRKDTERMRAMTQKVAQIFADAGLETGIDDLAVIEMICLRHGCESEQVTIQERHIAMAFQKVLFEKVPAEQRAAILEKAYGYPPKAAADDEVKTQGEIRSALMKSGKAAFVVEEFLTFPEAKELILELGGIPCYPTLADGTDPICEYERPVEALIEHLKSNGLFMAEYIPIRNTPEVLGDYVRAVRAAGIVVVGGTEHNTLDLLGIEPTCLKEAAVPQDVREIFFEGMCVIAAHQNETLNGRVGFVNADGTPNENYASDEERIAAFAALGAKVITATLQNT